MLPPGSQQHQQQQQQQPHECHLQGSKSEKGVLLFSSRLWACCGATVETRSCTRVLEPDLAAKSFLSASASIAGRLRGGGRAAHRHLPFMAAGEEEPFLSATAHPSIIDGKPQYFANRPSWLPLAGRGMVRPTAATQAQRIKVEAQTGNKNCTLSTLHFHCDDRP